MKKLGVILSVIVILVMIGATYVNAYTDTYTLQLEVINNKKSEKIDLYILLPKEYIIYAIKQDNLNLTYDGANTLKKNQIPSIQVESRKVKEDIYEENGIEYVQILLEPNEEGIYEFEVLSDYTQMNLKYRAKNIVKDYIMHIDNFKVESGKCQIKYDYEKNTIKQPNKTIIPFATKALIVLLIIIIVVGGIAYIKQRR